MTLLERLFHFLINRGGFWNISFTSSKGPSIFLSCPVWGKHSELHGWIYCLQEKAASPELWKPSDELRSLVEAVEKAIRECVTNHDLHADVFTTTLRYLKLHPSAYVGCPDHKEALSKKIVKFYLTMRLFFVADRVNADLARKAADCVYFLFQLSSCQTPALNTHWQSEPKQRYSFNNSLLVSSYQI